MAKRKKRAPRKRKPDPKRLPTLAECEKALGEKAETWVARCYEISCAIVRAGLVKGQAVYGHWVGRVSRKSHFANRRHLPFIPHGWLLLEDGRVLDPTRWVFEAVAPYLYVGEPPDDWSISPCANCGLIYEEHTDDGPADQCGNYEQELWPYDEGGNKWREAEFAGRPKPEAKGPLKDVALTGFPKVWLGGVLGVPDASKLAASQLMYVANMSYDALKRAVGPAGVKMIYEVIYDFDETSVSWIPLDNFNRARRECGLTRDY